MRTFLKGFTVGVILGLAVLVSGAFAKDGPIAPKGCKMTVYQAYLALAEQDFSVVEVPEGRKTAAVIYEVRHSGIKGAEQLDKDKPDRVDLAIAKDGTIDIVLFSRQNCVQGAAKFSQEHFVALMQKVQKDVEH